MMRLFSIALWLGMAVPLVSAGAANAPIHAGPVYTQGDATGSYPQYPELQVQVDVPAGVTPDAIKPETFSLDTGDGSPVPAHQVQPLKATGYGVAASFSIDVSGSMQGAPLQAVRSGLLKFVGDAGPADKIAIQTIANEGRWDVHWDDSRDHIRTALAGLATRGTVTRLWDGLLEAIHHFPPTPLSQRLIVISDGHDEGSVHTAREVIAAANAAGIVVDAIGITRSNPVYMRSLQSVSAQTGGLFRQAKDSPELERLVGGGIQVAQQTPVVSFRVKDLAADGRTHRWNVLWKHDGQQLSAAILVKVPLAPPAAASRKAWYWGGGIAALVLLTLIFALTRRKKPAFVPTAAKTPVRAATGAIPAMPPPVAPVRERTVGRGPQPRPAAPQTPPREPIPQPEPRPAPVRAKTSMGYRVPASANGVPAIWLFCQEGFAPGKVFPLDKVEFWIGSLENNHLRITDDPTVSGNHACIVVDHDVLGIYDHHSTNGTGVNGELMHDQRCLLRPGDLVRVGRSTFVVQAKEEAGTR